jgi:hypothetical protein
MKNVRRISTPLVATALAVTAMALAGCGGSGGLTPVPGKFRFGGRIVAQSVDVGVTHVYAVSTEAASVDRVLAPLDGNGRFVIDLSLGRSYVIGVIDATRVGILMVRGHVEVDGVRAFPVNREGVFELGAVAQRDALRWSSEFGVTNGLLARLGVSGGIATMLAAQDGLALRFLNPDIDGNGVVDVQEPGKSFLADVSLKLEAHKGGAVVGTVDDIRNGTVPNFTAFAVDPTEPSPIVVSFGYFTQDTQTASKLRFIDADGVVTKIEPTGQPDLESDNDGDFGAGPWWQSGVFQALELGLAPTSELPRGEIRVTFAPSATLVTFFPMLPQMNADLRQGYDHAFAFVHLTEDPTSGSCASSPCTFTQLGFRWKVATATGIRDATLADLGALVASGSTRFRFTLGPTNAVDMSIPSTAVSGTIPWLPENANLGNVSGTSFMAATRQNLCNTRVEHADRFGLRYDYRIARAAIATSCP